MCPLPGSAAGVLAPLSSRETFLIGCRDSLPVCVTFLFMFASIGALGHQAGFTPVQSASMTVLVHAAPLQALLVQQSEGLSVAAVLLTTLVVNFRFVIMSSALADQFRQVGLHHALWSVQLLSASTFVLANNRGNALGSAHAYYLGCGSSTLACAVVATLAGHFLGQAPSAWASQVLTVILPLHFAALACMGGRLTRALLATAMAFAASPLAGHVVGALHVIVVPLGIAAAFTAAEAAHRRGTP